MAAAGSRHLAAFAGADGWILERGGSGHGAYSRVFDGLLDKWKKLGVDGLASRQQRVVSVRK